MSEGSSRHTWRDLSPGVQSKVPMNVWSGVTRLYVYDGALMNDSVYPERFDMPCGWEVCQNGRVVASGGTSSLADARKQAEETAERIVKEHDQDREEKP